jgi:hypothetical protein
MIGSDVPESALTAVEVESVQLQCCGMDSVHFAVDV